MKIRELLATTKPERVLKGHNLEFVGWNDGYMVVKFFGRDDQYIYGPRIAECEKDKILKNPYPDSLWNKLVKKNGWQHVKVEAQR